MKIQKSLLAPLLIATAVSAQADITLFNDNYNITGDSHYDANFELEEGNTRQADGTTEAYYTTAGNAISDNEYVVDGAASKLMTNFITGIGANDFILSIDGRLTSGAGWIAFSMVNTAQGGRGSSDISFRIHSNNVFISGSNPINMPQSAIRDIAGLENWTASDSNTYAFVADATDALTGTYDFTINGIVAQENVSYTFEDLGINDRTLDWAQVSDGNGAWDNTTLVVVP